MTVSASLDVAAAVWSTTFADVEKGFKKIILYSLLSKTKSSFLIVEVDPGVSNIRMSDKGDKMFTGNHRTGEVKVYDMAELFTYNHFKETLTLSLQTDDCEKLANFFKLPKDQTDAILCGDTPSESLLFALEKKDILHPHNVDGLRKAFEELITDPFCGHVTEIFMKTRSVAFYEEIIKAMNIERKMARLAYEEEARQLKEMINAAQQEITQQRKEFKAECNTNRLQFHYFQEELESSKKSRTETEKVLKQTEAILQTTILEKNAIGTEFKQWQIDHSLNSMTLEEERKRQNTETLMKDFLSPTAYADQSKYLREPLLGDEFSKLIVKVSTRLTRTNCVYLARYFNFSPPKVATIQEESKTPGLDLLDAMKEQNIINMYNVTELQKALVDLQLNEINEILVVPYHRKIDPRVDKSHKVL